jgi:hypothetical protein
MLSSLTSAAGTVTTAVPVDQRYLFEARQMQALSSPCTSRWSASASPSRRWSCSPSGGTCAPGIRCTGRWPGAGPRSCWRCSRWGGHRDDPVVRAGLLWPVWIRTSATCSASGSRWRGSRSSSRPSSSGSTCTAGTGSKPRLALPVRAADRAGRDHRLDVRHLRQRLDEPPHRVPAVRRAGGGRAPVVRAVRQPVLLERVRAHVLRRPTSCAAS